MTTKTKKIASAVLAGLLVFAMIAALIVPVFADDLDELEQEENRLRQQQEIEEALASATEEEIQRAQESLDTIKAEMEALDRRVMQATEKLMGINQQISDNEALLERTQIELDTASEDMRRYYGQLKGRIQMMYENDRTTYLDVLLQARSISDFFSRMEYISQMVEYDNNIIEHMHECKVRIENSKATIEETHRNLEQNKADQQLRIEELEDLYRQKQVQMSAMEEDMLVLALSLEEQKNFIAEIQRQIQANQAEQQEILDSRAAAEAAAEAARQAAAQREAAEAARREEERRRAEEERRRAEEEASSGEASGEGEDPGESSSDPENSEESSGGEDSYGEEEPTYDTPYFIRPISGWYLITDTYGWRDSTSSYHYGVDLACSEGTSILASEGGEVIVAGYDWSFGNYIRIDHGNGWTTLYAHCSAIYVSVGDYVSQGDIIAAVGNTGFSFGSHLHFEIWQYGERLNPAYYVSV